MWRWFHKPWNSEPLPAWGFAQTFNNPCWPTTHYCSPWHPPKLPPCSLSKADAGGVGWWFQEQQKPPGASYQIVPQPLPGLPRNSPTFTSLEIRSAEDSVFFWCPGLRQTAVTRVWILIYPRFLESRSHGVKILLFTKARIVDKFMSPLWMEFLPPRDPFFFLCFGGQK